MNILGNAPLRIAAPADEYYARLVKLIPAEILALYLTFKEIASGWLVAWTWICLVLVILARTIGTSGTGKGPQWIAVLVASVSFVLWIYATGGYLIQVPLPTGSISVAIGVFTLVVPWFYKG